MLLTKAALALSALQALQSLPTAMAKFRVTCSPFKRERIDPIATPGKENAHMHTFFGNRAIGPDKPSYEELVGGCGTCNIAGDKSSYWMPTLYYVDKNATLPVKVAIFHVYYEGQSADFEPFPTDYNIISGNPALTEEEAKAQGGIGMSWHFEESDEVKEDWQLPKQKGGGWLRGNVPFPSNVVKDETLGRYRACTDSDTDCFRVPLMFFAVWYDLRHEYFDFQDGAYLTLSSGGGHTYHGDFLFGWEESFASMIVNDETDYIDTNGIQPVGGESSLVKSAECQKEDEEGFSLGGPDWDTMLEAYAGNGTVDLGTYDRNLTITDGLSMNATFSGKWGDAIEAVAQAVSVSASAAASETSAASSTVETESTAIATSAAGSTVEEEVSTSSVEPASSAALPTTLIASASPTASPTLSASSTGAIAVATRKARPIACSKSNRTRRCRHYY